MLDIELDARSVGRIRFAPSPAHEVVGMLAMALCECPLPSDVLSGVRTSLRRPDVRLLTELVRTHLTARRLPDVLLPNPGRGSVEGVLSGQLDKVATADADALLADLEPRTEGPPALRDALLRPGAAGTLAGALSVVWQTVLAERWPMLRTTVERDVAYRSDRTAEDGIGAAIDGLHRDFAWSGDGFSVATTHWQGSVRLSDTELVLVPVLFSVTPWGVQVHDETRASVNYAARRGPSAPAAESQRALIGASRAEILRSLELPRSTSEVGELVGLSPATASYHLGILHRAGLVSRERHGRVVHYRAVGQNP